MSNSQNDSIIINEIIVSDLENEKNKVINLSFESFEENINNIRNKRYLTISKNIFKK
jgi:hypothetical protein